MAKPLTLSRLQVIAFRRQAGLLNQRLSAGANSLRLAAWAGLQDSAPRAALLSIHARVQGTVSNTWEHPEMVQTWGPRFSDYVVAAEDLGVFSLGRLPDQKRGRARAVEIASKLHRFLDGRRMPFGEAGREMGLIPNSLRYAAQTGTVLLRWDGARQPVIWTVPAPNLDPLQARLELCRRYLHVFGPATAAGFAQWAGIGVKEAIAAFHALDRELIPVRTPIGDSWILAQDEDMLGTESAAGEKSVRFLPSGDAYFLLWGECRELLVPDANRRAELWTTRVWPGALLVNGEICGVWRRSALEIRLQLWRKLSRAEWTAVETEAGSLPLSGSVTIRTA